MWNRNAVKKGTITAWPILDLNPVSPDPCHTHTHREVKSTLLSCCWGANGLPLCIIDPNAAPSPTLTPLPAPSWLCPSVLHLTHPSLFICTFCVLCPLPPLLPIICLFVLCLWYFFLFAIFPTHELFSLCSLISTALSHTSWWMSNLVSLYSAMPCPCSIMAHLILSH